MLKREHLKQAVDQIGARLPQAGLALDQMLASGQLEVLPDRGYAAPPRHFSFFFAGDPVHVPVYRFFQEGTAALEERLLVKYGELMTKRALSRDGGPLDYRRAALAVHEAGLAQAVEFEAGRLLDLLDPAAANPTAELCRAILAGEPGPAPPGGPDDPAAPWMGVVDADTPACFAPLVLGRQVLMQVTDLNLEFFGPRTLLAHVAQEGQGLLYGASVAGRLLGVLQLAMRPGLWWDDLEIKYVASVGGRPAPRRQWAPPHPKGVGALLVAGAWMLWRRGSRRLKRLVLDSEIGSLGFYEALGFTRSGAYGYVLREPRGRLLRNLLVMAQGLEALPPAMARDLGRALAGQVDRLAGGGEAAGRALELVRWSLAQGRHPELGREVLARLARRRRQVPQADQLMDLALAGGVVRAPAAARGGAHLPLVLWEPACAAHLEGVLHLESAKRLAAMGQVVGLPEFQGLWAPVLARPAAVGELARVHTPAHLARLAASQDQALTALDLDTQTTPRSYEVARLAAGGVISVLEAIRAGQGNRGLAWVRPPGHHAGPDRAMGYCLVNNVAVGARHLRAAHGVERVAIVDIDAHHGNGTQDIFYDDPSVLYFSWHQYPHYPGTGHLGQVGTGPGQGFTVNLPLPARETDATFLLALEALVAPVLRQFQPWIILVSLGLDLYHRDPTAEMKATSAGYGQMTRWLLALADEVCEGRICLVMEGGYSLEGIRRCGAQVMGALCRPGPPDEPPAGDPWRHRALRRVLEVQETYWRLG